LDDSLSRLVDDAQRGRPGAFAALAEALRPNIFQLTSRFARNDHDFDDLSQEICLRLWKALPGLRRPGGFLGWFRSLAVHACYDWLRRRRTRQDREVALPDNSSPGQPWEEPSDEDEAAVRAAARLYAAMEQLRPEERLVLALLELEEHSVAETAELTGWSEGNIRVRAHRARHALRAALTSSPAS
jgi:RNA polymerase sigma-70 factor (ECF subfamily)